METLVLHLAINGAIVLLISMVAGLFLYLAIRGDQEQRAWHLLHAGGSGRGVMLIAMAAIIQYLALPPWLLALCVWLIIVFVWTSMAAMAIYAISGQRGVHWTGAIPNRLVYLFYGIGTIAIFPGMALLIYGLAAAF